MLGFIRIRTILFIILLILVLSFFSFDIQSFIESPQTQSNLGYVWGGVTYVWDSWLATPLTYLWNDIFIDLLWNSFVVNLQNIQGGGQNSLQQMGSDLVPFPDN